MNLIKITLGCAAALALLSVSALAQPATPPMATPDFAASSPATTPSSLPTRG